MRKRELTRESRGCLWGTQDSQNSWLPSFFCSCSVLLSHWNVTEASLLSATTPPSMDRLSWGPKVTVLPFQSPPSACHPHCRLPTSVP